MSDALLWLTATLLAYACGRWLQERTGQRWIHPVLVAVALLAAVLLGAGVPYERYATGGDLVGFFLGPSVVALGVSLHLQLRAILRRGRTLLLAIGVGSVVGVASAAGAAWFLGAPASIVASVAPKSVTTPIAIAVAEQNGGIPAVAAVLVIAVGIFGAVAGPPFLRAIGVRDPEAQGLALGAAAHGLGAARAFEEGERQGASAALAIGLQGVATALATPLVLWLLGLLG
ncbi:LrgB family protein [Vulgatibacter sp.]|uniref:LrgB family protein n=1 Tax=Vulgatibacter sp. TaxID=1971226 RepID=UPI00356213DA